MRLIFYFFIFISLLQSLYSSNDYSLILYPNYIVNTGIKPLHKEVYLYKNNQLLKKVDDKKNLIIFDSLAKGEYRIKYKTLFNQFIELDVMVEDSTRYELPIKYKIVYLYIDSINYDKINYKSIIYQLKNNESYKIKYISNKKEIFGPHYSSNMDSLIITKTDSNYNLTHGVIFNPQLKSNDIMNIDKFEKELFLINNLVNCSKTNNYRIYFRGKVMKYYDKTCEWNGFMKLEQQLFYLNIKELLKENTKTK